ncbi:hypothetical protein A4V04_02460 [Burkholderiales bacterium YL45]|uniref:Uncharacterized protein n=1 Tax=Turicimonas muris TaxID=1796652 RepID=A0A227KTJ8_9BURK|nr:hypothetical protein A4V04_02460 [Burkholderiales bacterium YL45]OXE51224.1 hypothetical protein ADH67_02710 [Turicimonas muris]
MNRLQKFAFFVCREQNRRRKLSFAFISLIKKVFAPSNRSSSKEGSLASKEENGFLVVVFRQLLKLQV